LDPWPGGFFRSGSDKTPRIKWQPFQGDVGPAAETLVYPSWLAGTWQVKYTKQDIRFPQGWGMLNQQLPGIAMASILRLPNVGAEPLARWRFVPVSGDGAQVDWAFTLPRILESFWDKARATSVPEKRLVTANSAGAASDVSPPGGWAIAFKSPIAGKSKKDLPERTVTLTWLAGSTYTLPASKECFSVEWIRQQDELMAPNGVSDYKVLTSFKQDKSGSMVSGHLRIAAFLRPLDEAYIEANGEAVAVYDYAIDLQRLPDLA